MLLAGAVVLHGWGRALLWTAAAAIDYAGPAWLTRQRLRGLQHVAVAHFAERYGSFVIICLGESILAVGVGLGTATDRLTVAQVVGAVLALLIAIGLWWTYFDRFAERAQARLRAPSRSGAGRRRRLQLHPSHHRGRDHHLRRRHAAGRPRLRGGTDADHRTPVPLRRRGALPARPGRLSLADRRRAGGAAAPGGRGRR